MFNCPTHGSQAEAYRVEERTDWYQADCEMIDGAMIVYAYTNELTGGKENMVNYYCKVIVGPDGQACKAYMNTPDFTEEVWS